MKLVHKAIEKGLSGSITLIPVSCLQGHDLMKFKICYNRILKFRQIEV